MPKHPAWKATRYAAQSAEKAITGLGRWATTDHTGTAKLLADLPPMGWMNAPATCNRMVILLRYMYNLAKKWKIPGGDNNPTAGVQLFQIDNARDRYLTSEETLLATVDASANAIGTDWGPAQKIKAGENLALVEA